MNAQSQQSVGLKALKIHKFLILKDKEEFVENINSLQINELQNKSDRLLVRLRKENKELKMEKEILKKAADGTFTIHITLIDFQAIGRVVKDFIQIRKAIWSFSFNFFFPYERRCNGCCERYSRCNEISV